MNVGVQSLFPPTLLIYSVFAPDNPGMKIVTFVYISATAVHFHSALCQKKTTTKQTLWKNLFPPLPWRVPLCPTVSWTTNKNNTKTSEEEVSPSSLGYTAIFLALSISQLSTTQVGHPVNVQASSQALHKSGFGGRVTRREHYYVNMNVCHSPYNKKTKTDCFGWHASAVYREKLTTRITPSAWWNVQVTSSFWGDTVTQSDRSDACSQCDKMWKGWRVYF